MKKLLSFLLILSVALGTLPALAGAPDIYYAVVNNPDSADRLNLRFSPSKDALSLGKYYNGTVVRVLGQIDESWVQVQVGDHVGYMMKEYLQSYQSSSQVETVAPVTPVVEMRNPYAALQFLLDSTGREMNTLVPIPNGAAVVVLGVTEDYAHVQYGGVTGYVPLACLNLDDGEEVQGANSVMLLPASLEGNIIRATLYMGNDVVERLDADTLAALSALLTSTEYLGYNMAGCPFTAVLMLEYQGGRIETIELAADSCCIYRHNGHDYKYARSLWKPEMGVDNVALFSLFGVTLPQ